MYVTPIKEFTIKSKDRDQGMSNKTAPNLNQGRSPKMDQGMSNKKGAMKQGRGTCSTLKPFNLTYLNVLRS